MYCKNCGNEVKNNNKYCPHCGTALAEQENVTKKIMIKGVEMSAADMVEYCIENKFINIANLWANQTKKEWRIYFENIINEIQSDETPILCFAGNHDYEGGMNTSGMHSYVLTDKRLIIAGWCEKKSSMLNPIKAYTVIFKAFMAKNPKCDKASVYIRDITGTSVDMISGHDVITFHTVKGDFNVMFYNNNVTHEFCDKINEALKQIKEK